MRHCMFGDLRTRAIRPQVMYSRRSADARFCLPLERNKAGPARDLTKKTYWTKSLFRQLTKLKSESKIR